jgi:molybdenum cofactor biosynthesis enzyme MoaA
MYDFANILFSGPCNARCYFCIGKQIDPRLSPDNLKVFPPRNLEALIALVWEHGIRQVVLTGTNTDPQRYRHEARLVALLRERLPAGTQIALHTNGLLALRKMGVFNLYDRVALSFPSFESETYRQMMGLPRPPDLERILARTQVPVKVSCLLDRHNLPELPGFLARCRELGVRRVVLRKLYGEEGGPKKEGRSTSTASQDAFNVSLRPYINALGLEPRPAYRGNAVYAYGDMEVTLWDFEHTTSTALNLFANGQISTNYLLAEAT